MRKDAIYYDLHMPWENTWLAAPTRYAAIRQALRTAGVQVKDINVTLGGCAFWHAVISIKKQPGEGKNALLAALSVMDLKHVVVVDDDIDVNDPTEVEWAIATRVQGDRDVMIVTNARAKPLDPSLPQGYGVVPTGAKVGIDATIPEGIPREYYERITYAYADTREDRGLCRRQEGRSRRGGDEAAVAALADEDPRRDRKDAALLHRHRREIRAHTISSPSPARSAICTRPRSCGRTRAAACACAARRSRPSRRGSKSSAPATAGEGAQAACGRRPAEKYADAKRRLSAGLNGGSAIPSTHYATLSRVTAPREARHAAFFFHLTDGKKTLSNHKGVDLPGDAAARLDAVALARDLKHGAALPGWDWTGWFVAIVDQHGRKLDQVPIADS